MKEEEKVAQVSGEEEEVVAEDHQHLQAESSKECKDCRGDEHQTNIRMDIAIYRLSWLIQ